MAVDHAPACAFERIAADGFDASDAKYSRHEHRLDHSLAGDQMPGLRRLDFGARVELIQIS